MQFRVWQFAHPRPLSLLQRGLAPRSKGKARAELRPARRQAGRDSPYSELEALGDREEPTCAARGAIVLETALPRTPLPLSRRSLLPRPHWLRGAGFLGAAILAFSMASAGAPPEAFCAGLRGLGPSSSLYLNILSFPCLSRLGDCKQSYA